MSLVARIQANEEALLTVAEVADLLRLSQMTVYRLIGSGEIPAIRVGRTFRVRSTALDACLMAGQAGGEDDASHG